MTRGPYILTRSGIRFYPLDPRAEDINIEDVAFALSNICRYGGHVDFYSVGEHSVLVSDMIAMSSMPPLQRLLGAFAGLLHDGAEAYPPGDILGPVKGSQAFAGAVFTQEKIEACVSEKFAISRALDVSTIVHAADQWLLVCEADALNRPCGPDELAKFDAIRRRVAMWKFPTPAIRKLTPARARKSFLTRYHALSRGELTT